MTYGIIGFESGTALGWFDSQNAAFAAARAILLNEPEARDTFGITRFDDGGHPVQSWQGEALIEATLGHVHA